MTTNPSLNAVLAAIGVFVCFILIRHIVRNLVKPKTPPISTPTNDLHILRSDYDIQSDDGVNRQTRIWHVPKDPQDYAKIFVPKGKNK